MMTASSNSQLEYVTSQFTYTTAQIAARRFCGETPNPLYFVMPSQPIEVSPAVLTVIDGEPCIVRDASPPGARFPPPNDRLYESSSMVKSESPA